MYVCRRKLNSFARELSEKKLTKPNFSETRKTFMINNCKELLENLSAEHSLLLGIILVLFNR